MRLQYNRKAAVSALQKSDQKLAQIIDRVGPFQLKTRNLSSPFETLMRSIIGQQLSGKAAASIYGRVIKLNNDKPPRPRQVLKTDDEAFRGAGMAQDGLRIIVLGSTTSRGESRIVASHAPGSVITATRYDVDVVSGGGGSSCAIAAAGTDSEARGRRISSIRNRSVSTARR